MKKCSEVQVNLKRGDKKVLVPRRAYFGQTGCHIPTNILEHVEDTRLHGQ
jgi:hypothetical protein